MSEKIQKVLARQGLGSRREIETWLQAGRIFVNGKKALLGDRISLADQICVDNQAISLSQATVKTQLLCYNKPEGEVCTRTDPEGRPTVFRALPLLTTGRWVMIGRLDLNTSGLLLFTNSGELAHRLMHPRHHVEREYAVKVMGHVTKQQLDRLQSGVDLDDRIARFTSIQKDLTRKTTGLNQWYYVTLLEGRYREVRRLWESQGLQVNRLVRIRYGAIVLPKDLPRGQYRALPDRLIQTL